MQFFHKDDLLENKALMFDKGVIYSRFFLLQRKVCYFKKNGLHNPPTSHQYN